MIKYTLNGETIEIDPKDEKQFKVDFPDAKISGLNSSENESGEKKYSISTDHGAREFKSGDELLKTLDSNPSYYHKIKSGELKLDIQNDSELSEKIDKELNKNWVERKWDDLKEDPLGMGVDFLVHQPFLNPLGQIVGVKYGLDALMNTLFPPPTPGDTYEHAISPELNDALYDENGVVKEDVLNDVVNIANDTTFNPFKKGKEGRTVDALNKLFEGQSDITFREAHAGRNAIKVDIGDVKDEIEFELSGYESGLQELMEGQVFSHVKRKTSEMSRDKHDAEIYGLIKNCKHLEGDASNYHRAKFADCIDSALGKKNTKATSIV